MTERKRITIIDSKAGQDIPPVVKAPLTMKDLANLLNQHKSVEINKSVETAKPVKRESKEELKSKQQHPEE